MDNIDIGVLKKMIFVYNAVLNGWTVSKINDNQFRCKKKINNNENNLKQFVKLNTKIPKN